MNQIDPDIAAFLGDTAAAVAKPADPLSFLNAIAEAKPKSSKRKDYPIFHDTDGTVTAMADRAIDLSGTADRLESNNRLLGDTVLPEWFKVNHRRTDTTSALKVLGTSGAVLVACQKRLKKLSGEHQLAPVKGVFKGEEKRLFRWGFTLKIEGADIPPDVAPGLVGELTALFARHGAAAALKVEKTYQALPSFHIERHQMFTPEENMQINRVAPLVTQVKTKDVS